MSQSLQMCLNVLTGTPTAEPQSHHWSMQIAHILKPPSLQVQHITAVHHPTPPPPRDAIPSLQEWWNGAETHGTLPVAQGTQTSAHLRMLCM